VPLRRRHRPAERDDKDKAWRRACFDIGLSCIVSEDMWNAVVKMIMEFGDKDIDYRAIQDFYKEEVWLSGEVAGESR